MVEGIGYIHQNWVMHRDLKPANMIINEHGIIKIIDFNSCKIYGSPYRIHTQGITSLWWRAPEQLLGSGYYGPAIDIWALGCIFAELHLRRPLFGGHKEHETDIDMLQRIFALLGTITRENWPEYYKLPQQMKFTRVERTDLSTVFQMTMKENSPAIELLEAMLQLDPNQRPSAQEVLNHRYFQEGTPPCLPSELPL